VNHPSPNYLSGRSPTDSTKTGSSCNNHGRRRELEIGYKIVRANGNCETGSMLRSLSRLLPFVLLLTPLMTGCQEEFPVSELGTIHEDIPFVKGAERPITIEKQRPLRRKSKTPGRPADRVTLPQRPTQQSNQPASP